MTLETTILDAIAPIDQEKKEQETSQITSHMRSLEKEGRRLRRLRKELFLPVPQYYY